jgi:hypothetical protein
MVLHGKMRNGVVVLDDVANVPDGTVVAVFVSTPGAPGDVALAAERERRKAALAELLAMPDENPGDTFSGRDHDKVLYGDQR